jgi:hypothetical protein
MSWGFVAVAAATVVSGAMSSNSAKKGAKAQGRAADAATAETARQYDQTREDLASGRNLYDGANNALARLMGLGTQASGGYFNAQQYLADNPDVAADKYFGKNPEEHWNTYGQYENRKNPIVGQTPGTPAGAGDLSQFMASPDYNFRRTEGQRGIEGTFAARGMGQSGNALRALTEFNSNLAAGEFGNYFNRLSTLAGQGSAATNQTAAYGADAASQAGRNALIAGNARASGIQGQSDAWGDTANGLASLYGYYKNPRSGGRGGMGTGVSNYPGMG